MADTLYLSALRTQSLPFRIEEFINFKVVEIANKTLVRAIRDEAILKDMPQRYVNGIKVEFDGNELWVWVDFEGDEGEPLGLFFEEGTDTNKGGKHFIKPKVKKSLAWLGEFFSKGHWITGIKARHVFRDGALKGYPEFKKLLQKEIESYIEETRLFGR